MVIEIPQVRDYISYSPIFVFKKSNLFCALDIMKSFNVDNLSIINEEFSIIGNLKKRQIIKILNNNFNIRELKTKNVQELLVEHNLPVVLYERMSIFEAYSTMKCLNVQGLPIADLPWEKKFLGYLWLDDIKKIVEDNQMKMSV